jgi:hypothetical protein
MTRSFSPRRGAGVLTGGLLLLAACSGEIGTTDKGISGTGTTNRTGSLGGPGGVAGAADCSAHNPGPSFVRRLNRFEYNNTVRDLLGDDTSPADDFPAEERRMGFDNTAAALQISPVLAEQYMLSAEKLANAAIAKISTLLGCDPAKDGEDSCAKSFIASFGAKAFRHPLAADESTRLWNVFDAGRKLADFATGVRMVIETALQSPAFLYRVEFGVPPANGEAVVKLTSSEMASRLSYMLWQSMPDDALRTAAQQDKLTTPEAISTQVDRMLADPKAREVVGHFNDLWLHLDQYDSIEKDPSVFSSFTPDLVPLMAQETHKFLEYVIFDANTDVGSLFTAPYTFVNAKLAGYYGIKGGPSSDSFAKVALDPTQRLGLLTQGGLLSVLAKANQTAPVQRGKFVREQLFCAELPPPPPNIMIKPPEISPTLSTKERFAQHRTEASCNGCHTLMDPIGLTLEQFDGAGQFRTTENGKPIDVTGEINQSDVTGPFTGAAGLAQKIAASGEVKECVSKSWFRYAYGRAETDLDACTLAQVDQKFKDSGYKIKDLVHALTQTDAFLSRKYVPAGGAQ